MAVTPPVMKANTCISRMEDGSEVVWARSWVGPGTVATERDLAVALINACIKAFYERFDLTETSTWPPSRGDKL